MRDERFSELFEEDPERDWIKELLEKKKEEKKEIFDERVEDLDRSYWYRRYKRYGMEGIPEHIFASLMEMDEHFSSMVHSSYPHEEEYNRIQNRRLKGLTLDYIEQKNLIVDGTFSITDSLIMTASIENTLAHLFKYKGNISFGLNLKDSKHKKSILKGTTVDRLVLEAYETDLLDLRGFKANEVIWSGCNITSYSMDKSTNIPQEFRSYLLGCYAKPRLPSYF